MVTSRMSMSIRRGALLASAAIMAGAAQAQEAEPAAQRQEPTSIDDIVVTAQRREQRLQDVPIAISAVGAEELTSRGVQDLSALRGAVPGLSISTFSGVNATNLVAIRGVSGQPLPIGGGQATAIYLDGVYLSRPDAGFFALDDIERIEVLRGPQGALYGRNATAGAINIVTRAPGDAVRGGLDVSYGNFDSIMARASLSGPLGGNFSGGVSGAYQEHDGYLRNTVTGNTVGDRDSHTLRGVLRYETGDSRFSASLAGDTSAVNGQDVQRSSPPGSIGNPREVSLDALSESLSATRIRASGAALTLTYALNDAVDITSITSYRDVDNSSSYDGDGSPAPIGLTLGANTSESYNQEVRAVIDVDRWRATVGANYFHEAATFGASLSPPTAPVVPNNPFDTTDLDAWAIFGQAEYDITATLTIVAGLRYNNEQRDYSTDYSQGPTHGLTTKGQLEDDVLIPSIGLNYAMSPDVLLYIKASEGYQAPGFNFAPGAFAGANTFRAEQLRAYEAGVKSQFLERRVTLNVAAFYYDYKDLQVRSVTGLGVTVIDNAATANLSGVEGSLTARLAPGLTVGGQATYLASKYEDFCQPISGGTPLFNDPLCSGGLADRSGNRLIQAPEWSGGVFMDYFVPVPIGEIHVHVDYGFESNVFYTTVNEPDASSRGWQRADARIGLELHNGVELYVYGKNLTDDRFVGNAGRLSPAIVINSLNDPRTYGLGARFRF